MYTLSLTQNDHSGAHAPPHTHLSFSLDQDAGIQLDYVLHKDSLDVWWEGDRLGVQQAVQRGSRISQMFWEFSNNPGSCVEHFTDAVVVDGPSEEMGVLQDGWLYLVNTREEVYK